MNIKKIGLTALAGSLVAMTSSVAGEMSVAGSASLNVEHTNGGAADTGKTFSMGNQLTFTGGGELDNGLNVSLSFVLDQGDDTAIANAPFDSHSLTISSESFGSLVFSGEGGSSSTTARDATAAGDIWDQFDDETGLEPTGVGSGDNMMMYKLPAIMDGLAADISYLPTGSAADSAVGYGFDFTGVEGLTVNFATGDGTTVGGGTDATVMKASYAIGSLTAAYSSYEYDTAGTSSDDDVTGYKLSYTISDELSASYASETVEEGTKEAEYESVSASYTAGGMTITATMSEGTDIDGTTTATEDRERWALSASFAF